MAVIVPPDSDPRPRTSILLVIRGSDDLRASIDGASELLAHRRRDSASREVDEVLGIWLRRDLDADLPSWLWCGADSESSAPRNGSAGEEPHRAAASEAAIGIRESFSLAGRWSLCWIDGAALRGAATAAVRRQRILDAMVRDREAADGSFLPVFDAADPSDAVEEMLQDLDARYSDLVSRDWFIHDRVGGLVAPRRDLDPQ